MARTQTACSDSRGKQEWRSLDITPTLTICKIKKIVDFWIKVVRPTICDVYEGEREKEKMILLMSLLCLFEKIGFQVSGKECGVWGLGGVG